MRQNCIKKLKNSFSKNLADKWKKIVDKWKKQE